MVWFADCRECGVAFQSSQKRTTCGPCYLARKAARRAADKRVKAVGRTLTRTCSVCGLEGHNKSTCPATHPGSWHYNPWTGVKIE